MAMAGEAGEGLREFFFRVGRDLHRRGADTVLLAGTEPFLAFDGDDCGFPTVDCARAHVEALTALSLA